MKIAIAGGTGFIGKHLIRHFLQERHSVILISRRYTEQADPNVRTVTWAELENNTGSLEGVDAIVNLAGESINQRWTAAAKERILQSRLDTVGRIVSLVDRLQAKPSVVVNASGMSIYGTSETEEFDESSPKRITDFLADTVEKWEAAIDRIRGVRVVKLRVGVVLGNDGGAFPKMAMPYKLWVGGRIGSGRQVLSWIHIRDMVRLIDFCIRHDGISGPVNATAPNPVTNDEFGRALGRALGRPHLFPVPAFMFNLLFGELAVLLLEGQRVIPRVLLRHGFEFEYPTIERALTALTKGGSD
ncbi:TIGR01777 family oxidoreductase [Paenibacillus hamazuiensis]|uniref:TIGR01777 family oxidoreductase n=1 Tax=Paenibacillus hamazuiensis TaxID=2936508 RepID=UPI00200C396B|nr:TIGR01777 family oxidoreductase [Paenibacillus hamazuiensis]